MRIAWFQHVPFEDLGCIAPALIACGHDLQVTPWFAGAKAPALGDYDALIVMGGPMNVDEFEQHPWLRDERAAVRAAIDAGKPVLGICLGAQLIAASLGARVTRNAHVEIGWFDVYRPPQAVQGSLLAGFPERFPAFHWHGDTFALPPGADLLLSSEACAHQAFQIGPRVLGLQFHLEVTAANARDMYVGETMQCSQYVQEPAAVLAQLDHFAGSNRRMQRLLDNWLATV
ncbi:MAG TPA: type 1 glutamine amidotransferase [Fontimonas sp.]